MPEKGARPSWWPSHFRERVDSVQRHWLFAELDDAEWADLKAVAIRQRVAGGTRLFAKGDPTPGLHLVEEGAIKIYTMTESGAERIIDLVGPGEFCGEMGVVDRAPSSAWGAALGETALTVIPAAALERLLQSQPSVGWKISRVLAAKLRRAGEQLDEVLFLRSRERVLRHLVRLAERHGQPEGGGQVITLRLTHEELSRLAGTARETVSRTLAELQDRGLLAFRGRALWLRNVDALRQLAGC